MCPSSQKDGLDRLKNKGPGCLLGELQFAARRPQINNLK